MKLIRFGDPGLERPGLQRADGVRIDASAFGGDYDEAFFGGDGIERLRRWAEREAAARGRRAGGDAAGASDRTAEQAGLHRLELPRSRRRKRYGHAEGTGHFLQGHIVHRRSG